MIVGNESLDLTVQNGGMRWVSYGQLIRCRYNYTGIHKQGNRLTRRPYKGDEFEILIFEEETKLVFAGVVKKCLQLQHGHSFRLAGAWLESEKLRFACAGTWFCSSRVQKEIRNLWFSIIRIISGRHSLSQFFPLLDASGARAFVAEQKPQSATRQRCDAMSSCPNGANQHFTNSEFCPLFAFVE